MVKFVKIFEGFRSLKREQCGHCDRLLITEAQKRLMKLTIEKTSFHNFYFS